MIAAYVLPCGVLANTPNQRVVTTATGVPERSNGSVSISASPEHLSGPGKIVISITITNTNTPTDSGSVGANYMPSSYVLPTSEPTAEPSFEPTSEPSDIPSEIPIGSGAYTNVHITNDYGVNFQTYDVPAGETVTFSATMNVTSAQIGTNLTFRIDWVDSYTQTAHSQELKVMITRSDTAYLKLVRTMDKSSAQPGETVVLTYVMVNTGSLTLNNITLTDPAIAGNGAMLTPFSLASGQSVRYEYTYTMGNESVVSNPTATFTPAGSSTALSVTASKQTIGLINTQLTKEVVMGTPSPEGIPFTLYLTNNGNQRLSSLTVKDELGSTIASGFSLAIGETKIIEYFAPNPDATRYVVFYITGADASSNAFTDNTLSYAVHPYVDPSLLGLDLKVEVRTQLSSENIIGLTFTVTNIGSIDYTNLSLTEQLIEYELYHIEVLRPSAEGIVFNVDVDAGSERELVFTLTAIDASGNPHTREAHVTAAYFDPNGTAPDNPPAKPDISVAEDPQLGSKLDGLLTRTGETLTAWYNVLIVIAIIAVITIIALGVIEIRLRRSGEQRRSDDRQRRNDDRQRGSRSSSY